MCDCYDEQPLVLQRSRSHDCSTTTQTCHHHHSQDIVRRSSSPACFDLDDYCDCGGAEYCHTSSSNRLHIHLRELLDTCIRQEHTFCSSSCSHQSSYRSSCYHEHSRCTTCEHDYQLTISELMALVKCFGSSTSRGRGCGCSSSHHMCTTSHNHDYRSIVDIISRITQFQSHSHVRSCSHLCRSQSRIRTTCSCSNRNSQKLIVRLLDDLETTACGSSLRCECNDCEEYTQIKLPRLKHKVGGCGCNGAVCGRQNSCSGERYCDKEVTRTLIRSPVPKRQRLGNVHVGWNIG